MKSNLVFTAYSLAALMLPVSLGRSVLPSFYSWMEMNSYICEFSSTSAPVFLAGDEAEQFNCNDLCGDPTETRRACARLPDDLASNGSPQCHSVPELCVEEFVQQMIGFKLIHNLGGNDLTSSEESGVQRNEIVTEQVPSTTATAITITTTTPSTTTASTTTPSTTTSTTTQTTTTPSTTASTTTTTTQSTTTPTTTTTTTRTTPTTTAPSTTTPTTTATTPSLSTPGFRTISLETAFFAFNPTTTRSATTAAPRVLVTTAGLSRVSGEVPAHFAHRSTVQPKAKAENSAANVEQFDAPAELRTPNQLFVVDGNVFESAGSQKSVVVVRKHPEGARTGETQPASFVNHFRGALLTNAHSNCPEDGDFACPFWANLGECKINPRYMLSVCQRSCGVCHP